MSTNQQTSKSILASVASHEGDLLSQIETSQNEGSETIEQARAAARSHAQEAESTLNDEMATIRRNKDTARQAEFQVTVAGAEAQLESVREAAAAKVDAVAQDVLGLFLPKTKGEN